MPAARRAASKRLVLRVLVYFGFVLCGVLLGIGVSASQAGTGGLEVLVGAIIGAMAAIAGGLGGSLLLAGREERREGARALTAHESAVRAVLYEMNTNFTSLTAMQRQNSLTMLFVDDRIYHDSLDRLLAQLPGDLATDVAEAYFLVAGLRATHEFGFVKTALDRTALAKDHLFTYATDKLGLTIVISTPT